MPPLFPSQTASASPSPSGGSDQNRGLSNGAIAGIVLGSVFGAALILGLLILLCLRLRKRRRGSQASVFNQPTPHRRGAPSMTYNPQPGAQTLPPDYGPQPGGRVARMSALENNSSSSRSYANGAAAGVAGKKFGDTSESEAYNDTPEKTGPPLAGKRGGSLSSQSALGALDDYSSPNTDGQLSSPNDVTSGQSEQLPFFKDYYSSDEIHPNDKVSVLWAYQPRAGDEFELERGEMLKVVGIWDDGWATGVRIDERAEEYDPKRKEHRDSGVSDSSRRMDASPQGELKAFPLYVADFMGGMKKEEVFELLDFDHSQGGNFVDTANNYQSEQSEQWIGEWLASSEGLRDQMVVATTYTTCYTNYKGFNDILHSNSAGNGAKSLHVSLRNSLKKLQTDYIDILYALYTSPDLELRYRVSNKPKPLTFNTYVFPILGGRKVDHLKGNIEALALELSGDDINAIDGATDFDIGFPMNFLGGTGKPQDSWLMNASGQYDYVENTKPIPPLKELGSTDSKNPLLE
ncbi:uncharacterized protein KY384_007723 [Bacidia gigantensis]|uniref:uncharacterized protein n=1 Tax=Bacidia gigantensis TaxID=2732470 RepID=UPI001D04DFC1|nr:uncharacterized protein KY384_007723 [Bacidia gigantensis]KAG8527570.1 hypothetical protein KY384_007723 [Bacidia gigantensis]